MWIQVEKVVAGICCHSHSRQWVDLIAISADCCCTAVHQPSQLTKQWKPSTACQI